MLWTFQGAKDFRARPGALSLLGVERGSRDPCPEGAIRLSPGLNGAKIRNVWEVYAEGGAQSDRKPGTKCLEQTHPKRTVP
jgi:hypothetical protein